MGFVEFCLLFLALYGMTFLFVHSTIMDIVGLRQRWEKNDFLKKLFSCPVCTGFHAAWAYGFPLLFCLFFFPKVFYFLSLPFAAMSFCYLFDRSVILIDELVNKTEKENRRRYNTRKN